MAMGTVRLTMAQALVGALASQWTVVGGNRVRLFAGVWAIFGHGNVSGVGEALYSMRGALPTLRAHNEQARPHAPIAFARPSRRRRLMACTTSIGPGATNLVTAAAVAHVNRLRPDDRDLAEAVRLLRNARRPLVIAGGGVLYSGAERTLADFCEAR